MLEDDRMTLEKRVGIKEVARRANVSISTVSNVLNGSRPVSPELFERVQTAAQELNYEANPFARSLKSKKSNNIAVIVPSINSVFFPPLLQSIQNIASEHGFSVSIYDSRGDLEIERQYIQLLKFQWIDGIILSSCLDTASPDSKKYVHELSRLNAEGKPIPIVCIEAAISDHLDAVVVDDKESLYRATQYLISLGRKRIGFIGSPCTFSMGKLRKAGYLSALAEANYQIDSGIMLEGDYYPESGYQCMKLLLHTEPRIDAVVVGNDSMAIGAIRCIKNNGLQIPGDIAVIGFNNTFPSSLISPSLTTLSTPKEQMGADAVTLLFRRMNDHKAERKLIVHHCDLIIRESTDVSGSREWDFNWR